MTIRKRLDRLETQREKLTSGGPVVIFFSGPGREPSAAITVEGGTVTRNEGEAVEAFTARASASVSCVVCLPDNRRDALSTCNAL